MKQKLFTLFLALAASVGTMFAKSGTCGENLTWDLTNKVLTISGTGEMYDYYTSYSVPWYDSYSSIVSVIINDGVTSIGSMAFSGYYVNLTSVTISNTVTRIGGRAFSACDNLPSIDIPNSVTSIEKSAFAYCDNLTSINVSKNNPNYSSIDGVLFNKDKTTLIQYPSGKEGAYTIPNSVTYINSYAFASSHRLTSISIPNTVTSINEEAFSVCRSLTSITIPNSVKSIEKYAFRDCTGLISVTIPNSVTSIGWNAFYGCFGITAIYNFVSTPLTINDEAFYRVSKKACKLYVPEESVDLYKVADGWKTFTNILPLTAKEAEITTPIIEPDVTSAEIAWPAVSNAYTYEIVIKDANGNVICTLTFNAQGQLTAISFNAPARDNESQQTQSEGFAFTITGLTPGTQYSYSIIAKSESGATLNTETGSFTTLSPEGIDDVMATKCENGQKLLRDGQILILRGDKTYTLTGQEVK